MILVVSDHILTQLKTAKYLQGVSKKTGISVQGSFKALKWPKIKKSKKTDPP